MRARGCRHGREPTEDVQDVAAAFDLGRVLDVADEPVRGLQGQVWRLTTTTGIWAVKQTFAEVSEEDAGRTDEFSEAARRGGVPAPAVRLTRDRRHVVRIGEAWVRVQSWVDVDPPDALLDPSIVGRTLAALHRVIVPPAGSPHWWYTEPVGAARWDELVAGCRASRAPFADRLAELRDDLVALEMIMTPMAAIQLCHLDLWADNVRRTSAGGLCIIDWDNSGPADPSRELALVLFEFGRTDPSRIARLHGSYRDHGGPGVLHGPGDFAMVAAQLGHIGAMHLRRWLDPSSSPADRARALQGIDEFVGDPFTPATIDEILGAIG